MRRSTFAAFIGAVFVLAACAGIAPGPHVNPSAGGPSGQPGAMPVEQRVDVQPPAGWQPFDPPDRPRLGRPTFPPITPAEPSPAHAAGPQAPVAGHSVPTPPAESPGAGPDAAGSQPDPAGSDLPDQGAPESGAPNPGAPNPGAPKPGAPNPGAPNPGAPPAGGSGKPPGGPTYAWYPKGIGMPLVSDNPAAAGKRVVLLTFDDGPSSSGTTAQILDTLAEQKVQALFFVTGQAARNRELVERIHREGHMLAPHTMSHANLTRLSPEQIRAEIEPLMELLTVVTGSAPRYFRPPYGAYNQTVLQVLDEYRLELVNWTNGARDWEGLDNRGYKDPKLVIEDVLKQLHPGAVILMHDTYRHTAEALPELIRQIRAAGYEFTMLP